MDELNDQCDGTVFVVYLDLTFGFTQFPLATANPMLVPGALSHNFSTKVV